MCFSHMKRLPHPPEAPFSAPAALPSGRYSLSFTPKTSSHLACQRTSSSQETILCKPSRLRTSDLQVPSHISYFSDITSQRGAFSSFGRLENSTLPVPNRLGASVASGTKAAGEGVRTWQGITHTVYPALHLLVTLDWASKPKRN